MWKFTATTVRGKTLHYSAPSRDKARTLRANLDRAPFVVSTSAPTR